MKNSETLSWSIMEYQEKERSVDWYWTVGLLTLLAVVIAFYFRDYLFGVLIILSISTLVYLTFKKPREIHVAIGGKGIQVDNELYQFNNVKAFWVESDAPSGHGLHLLLMTNRLYVPMIAVPIGDIAPELIREKLQPHIEESEMRENPSHKFIEMLGF